MSVVIRNTVSPTVTTEEQELLQQIHAARRYPVCRFELRCSWEEDLISTALDAVHLTDANESMESVKSRAALLKSLEEKGLLVLFYDLKTRGLPVRLCLCEKRHGDSDRKRKIRTSLNRYEKRVCIFKMQTLFFSCWSLAEHPFAQQPLHIPVQFAAGTFVPPVQFDRHSDRFRPGR